MLGSHVPALGVRVVLLEMNVAGMVVQACNASTWLRQEDQLRV